jgi:hypothetical protein
MVKVIPGFTQVQRKPGLSLVIDDGGGHPRLYPGAKETWVIFGY